MVWTPEGEKKFEDTFSCFDVIQAYVVQTERQTDGYLETA